MAAYWLDVTARLLVSRNTLYDPLAWGDVVAVSAGDDYALRTQTLWASLPATVQKLCQTKGRAADIAVLKATVVASVGRTRV